MKQDYHLAETSILFSRRNFSQFQTKSDPATVGQPGCSSRFTRQAPSEAFGHTSGGAFLLRRMGAARFFLGPASHRSVCLEARYMSHGTLGCSELQELPSRAKRVAEPASGQQTLHMRKQVQTLLRLTRTKKALLPEYCL